MPHYSNKPVRYCGDTDHDQVKEFLTELPYSDLVPCRPSANVNNTAAPAAVSEVLGLQVSLTAVGIK